MFEALARADTAAWLQRMLIKLGEGPAVSSPLQPLGQGERRRRSTRIITWCDPSFSRDGWSWRLVAPTGSGRGTSHRSAGPVIVGGPHGLVPFAGGRLCTGRAPITVARSLHRLELFEPRQSDSFHFSPNDPSKRKARLPVDLCWLYSRRESKSKTPLPY